MSKSEKKNFALDSKEAFITYLQMLIIHTHRFFKRHKTCTEELNNLIIEYDIMEHKNKPIHANVYHDINDKIQYNNCNLFNAIGDHTTTAMSYKKFRAFAEKQNTRLCLGLTQLDTSVVKIINDMNVNRNWGLHIPESLLVASMEIAEKAIKSDKKYKLKDKNPMQIVEFEYYEGEWLLDLYNESVNLSTGFRKILQQMKKDYSILIGESVTVEVHQSGVRPLADMNIPKISFDIQNNKYKGIEDHSIWLW